MTRRATLLVLAALACVIAGCERFVDLGSPIDAAEEDAAEQASVPPLEIDAAPPDDAPPDAAEPATTQPTR